MFRTLSRAVGALVIIATFLEPGAARAGGSPVQQHQGPVGVSEPSAPASVGLPASLVDDVQPMPTKTAVSLASIRPATRRTPNVLLLSSGVDTSLLPAGVREKVQVAWGDGDAAGYGTYAASALLQLLPSVKITSMSTYERGTFNPAWQQSLLGWAIQHADEFDALLYAVPPTELVDPATLVLAGGMREQSWSDLLAVWGDNPMRSARGKAVLGLPTEDSAVREQILGASSSEAAAMTGWYYAVKHWRTAMSQARRLADAGLPMIVPAGDVGPNLQTVFGIANLPEVITVGAHDGRGVARSSASGPSMEGGPKPDVIAPANLPGLLPAQSALAAVLDGDGALRLDWFGGAQPLGGERVRVGSTIPAAAVVAAQVAALAADGIRDPLVLRGALVAAAEPLAATPAWRQGSGVLKRTVTADEVRARGVTLDAGTLGMEPSRGAWETTIRDWALTPTGAATSLTSFAGVRVDGRPTTRAVSFPSVVETGVGNDGVSLSTGMGETWDSGVYCGYTTIAVPRSSAYFSPTVSGDGLPTGGREHVPTCLVNGSRVRLHAFYIHDVPAEDLTYALLPDLPERQTVMDGLPKFMALDPFHELFFEGTTDAGGNLFLPNVPPGYYRFRLFADYGTPVRFEVREDGRRVAHHQDIGANPGYQDVLGYLLSGANLTRSDLEAAFGSGNVHDDKPTGTYLVTVGPKTIRIVLDFFKKMPGANVASRYIDLMSRDDFDYAVAAMPPWLAGLGTPAGLAQSRLPLGADGWMFEGVNAPNLSAGREGLVGHYNGAAAAAGGVTPFLGVAQYPFNLTTPNYRANVSVSFGYELENAALVVMARIGEEVKWASILDPGVAEVSAHSWQIVPTVRARPDGGSGLATFDFKLLSRGAASGTLTFFMIPAQALSRAALPVSRVALEDVSMKVETWTNPNWPGGMTPHGMGHVYGVTPRVAQMNHPECRSKQIGDASYDECEDWSVVVHSPLDDAATASFTRGGGQDLSGALRAAGGAFYDPHRGVSGFTSPLTHRLSAEAVRAGFDAGRDFRTNGRFWEQIVLPRPFLESVSDGLQINIVDNAPGRHSALLPRHDGGAAVAPWLPYPAGSSSDVVLHVQPLPPVGGIHLL